MTTENSARGSRRLLLRLHRELEHNVLPCQSAVHRRERIELVLQRRRVFCVKESEYNGDMRPSSTGANQGQDMTYTLRSFEPSTATRVRLPTISVGKTRSSRIFSWTLVRVRLRGRFCLTREVRVGLRSIRRCATKTTWRSENFFSSSRVSLGDRKAISSLCTRARPASPYNLPALRRTFAGPCGTP